MDVREQKGLEIAAIFKITKERGVWFVPSQTTRFRRYAVFMDESEPRCTCPDFETTHLKCKHIFAVEFTIRRETATDGATNGAAQTEPKLVAAQTSRPTYAQKWSAYNAAQTNEKHLFLRLLSDLCSHVESPVQTMGRPRLSLADQIFCATYKVFSTVSIRRFISDLDDARDKGYLTKTPHFNSVLNVFDTEDATLALHELIKRSSMPLKALETDFIVDSTGFGSSRFEKWFDVKHGGKVSIQQWVKVHAMAGVLTNIVASVEITGKSGDDTSQFPELVAKTKKQFRIREVSADKAYSSRKNHKVVADAGGTAYIAFKTNATGQGTPSGKGEGCEVFRKMFHFYSMNREEFLKHYHKRSSAESTFSMIKAKFGDSLRSKNTTAQINEALCKILAHNICVVIQSMYEFGVVATFCAEEEVAQKVS